MWLKVKEGETIIATIDIESIKSVAKHWTGQRSELCLGEGCPHCLAGLPKRWRYQARLIVDRTPMQWEFGEQVRTDLQAIPHDTNWAYITITRTGEGSNTRYDIASRLKEETTYRLCPNYQEIMLQRTDELVQQYRRNYGDTFKEEGEGIPHQEL